LKRELEALLFATDSPLTVARLKKIFPGVETSEFKTALGELTEEYDESGHAFNVVEFGGGWQIATKPEFSPIVEKMLKTRRFTRLSKAGLEVLAIIAYRQPLTRLEVDDIRGVNSSGAISTLTERNLIAVVGRSQAVGNPLLYGTTREFLNHLGLKGLGQLPDLPDIEGVMDNKEELKEFASQVGRDLTDEELEDYFSAPEEAELVASEGSPEAGEDAASEENQETEKSDQDDSQTSTSQMDEPPVDESVTDEAEDPSPEPENTTENDELPESAESTAGNKNDR
jgi:segregation and condensation protein B